MRTGYLELCLGSSEDEEEILEVSLVAKGPPCFVKGETIGVGTFEGGFPSSHGRRDRSEDSGDIRLLRDDAVWLLVIELNLLVAPCLLDVVLAGKDSLGSFAEA